MSPVDPSAQLWCCGLHSSIRHARRLTPAWSFIRCPTCRVLHIVPENLIHSTVFPDPVGKLSSL